MGDVASEVILPTCQADLTNMDASQQHNQNSQKPTCGSAPVALSSTIPSFMQPLEPAKHPGALTMAERLMPILQQGAFSIGKDSTPPIRKDAGAVSFASRCSPTQSSPGCVVPQAHRAKTLSADAPSPAPIVQKGTLSVRTSPIEKLLPILQQEAFSIGKVSTPHVKTDADAFSSAPGCSPTSSSPCCVAPLVQAVATSCAGVKVSSHSPKGPASASPNVLSDSPNAPLLGMMEPQKSSRCVTR